MKKEQYALIIYLLFFVVAVSMVFVLYKRHQQLQEYDQIQHNLIYLKELDARIDRDWLLNLSFYSSKHDSLAQPSPRIAALEHEILQQASGFSLKVPEFKTRLQHSLLQHYIDNIIKKQHQLERVKALASSIKNSLQSLPAAINELNQKILASHYEPEDLRFKINHLLAVLLDYNIFPQHDKKLLLEQQIAKLNSLSDDTFQKQINSILSAVQTNLKIKSQLENLLPTYEKMNLNKERSVLQTIYSNYYTEQSKHFYFVIILLVILSALLFISLGYVLQYIKKAYIRAKINHARLYDAIENIHEAFALFDADDRLVLWNRQFELFYPKIRKKINTGITYNELMSTAEELGQFKNNNSPRSHTDNTFKGHSKELEYLSDGRCFLSSDSKTSSGGTACIRIDISDQVKLEQKTIWQANYDALTRLPNRTLFLDRLAQAIQHAKRDSSLCALLFIDLDKFKEVNDTLGHDIGDALLLAVAERLSSCIRKIDTASRLGGDEFTIILQEISSTHDAATVAIQIINKLEEVFAIDEHEIFISASIGITVYPDDASNSTRMLSNADMAMYQAKEAGRNTYRFYTEEMNREMQTRLQLEKDLRNALTNNEFVLEYQPVIDSQSNRVVYAEALLRWHHPKLGRIKPDKFIYLAEETGFIIQLGEWVLRTAVRQMQQWFQQGLQPFSMAINISSRQLESDILINLLKQLLSETSLPRNSLTLEMTESLLIENASRSNNTLEQFRELGINLSIDDFGTGYSSLTYLKQFPVNVLKIHQSFIHDITQNKDDAILTCAIIDLAHNFNLRVIAEGVESIRQLNFLKQNGCDMIQGYYYSQALSAEDFYPYYSKQNRQLIHKNQTLEFKF